MEQQPYTSLGRFIAEFLDYPQWNTHARKAGLIWTSD